MIILNVFRHIKTVMTHKFYVFIFACKAGIPFRGLVHDMSKFSPSEFFESVKYYQGNGSPISAAKKENGYSKAWLHHKGRNKHHWQYWYDSQTYDKTPIIPYKYTVEMICDTLAAGKTYKGKNWKKDYQLSYWNKERKTVKMNECIQNVLTEVYTQVASEGINKIINRHNLKEIYNRCTNTKVQEDEENETGVNVKNSQFV